MRYIHYFALFLCLASLLCGCSLLPAEEELPLAPVLRQGQTQDYKMAYVQRGDLVLSKRYTASYVSVREQRLAFSMSGIPYANVFVKAGDIVRAGQVLAELEHDDISAAMLEAQNAIRQIELDASQTTADMAAAEKAFALEWAQNYDMARQESALQTLLQPYLARLQQLDTALAVQTVLLEDLRQQLKERQLICQIDGTVTHLKKINSYDVSIEDEQLIVVSDASSSMFVVEYDAGAPSPFLPGESVQVDVSGRLYEASVLSLDALPKDVSPKEGCAYLRVDSNALDLEEGDRGTILIEQDRKNDCLYLPSLALKEMDGQTFVYVIEENGVRGLKEVETGFVAGSNVEILRGLSQGDAVVLR